MLEIERTVKTYKVKSIIFMNAWSILWRIKFNQVMSSTRSDSPIKFTYSLKLLQIEFLSSFKDLGLIVDKDLLQIRYTIYNIISVRKSLESLGTH